MSEVSPATPLAQFGASTRREVPPFGLESAPRRGRSWEASPALALELRNVEDRKGTSEKRRNHELPGPSRKTSLISSERAVLVDKPKRIVDTEAALLPAGDTSLRARTPTHRASNSSSSGPTPGRRSPQTHTVWVLRPGSGSVPGPPVGTSELRPAWGTVEDSTCWSTLTCLCSSTLTVVVWLLGR